MGFADFSSAMKASRYGPVGADVGVAAGDTTEEAPAVEPPDGGAARRAGATLGVDAVVASGRTRAAAERWSPRPACADLRHHHCPEPVRARDREAHQRHSTGCVLRRPAARSAAPACAGASGAAAPSPCCSAADRTPHFLLGARQQIEAAQQVLARPAVHQREHPGPIALANHVRIEARVLSTERISRSRIARDSSRHSRRRS